MHGFRRIWPVVLIAVACLSGCARDLGTGAFVDAIGVGDVAQVREMLAKKPELIEYASGKYERTHSSALEAAARAPEVSRKELVTLLLNAGADPNECFSGWLDGQVMEMLLKARVRQELKDKALIDTLGELGSLRFSKVMDEQHKRMREDWREEALKEAQERVALLKRHGAGAGNGLWEAPANMSLTRLGQDSVNPVVRWDSAQGARLVRFHIEQTGSWMTVIVLDREYNIRRIGATHGRGSLQLYSLAEVKSSSPGMPSGLRGQWLLAAAWWTPPMDVSKPIYFVGRPDGGRENTLNCTLIHWVWSDGMEGLDYTKAAVSAAEGTRYGLANTGEREPFYLFGLELAELDLEVRPAEAQAPKLLQSGRVKAREDR